jgi:hypothetical protein
MTSRHSTAAPILAVLAIVLPFVLYVGGYFWLSERRDFSWSNYPDGSSFEVQTCIVRRYPHQWISSIYQPAGAVETRLVGTDVRIKFTSDP